VTGPTLRQTVEGMALGFDARAAAGRTAVLEFDAPAERPRLCHLVVDERGCRFGAGPAPRPTLRLRTDGATWRAIGAGELDAMAALADGRLSVDGDAGVLFQLRGWFRGVDARALPDAAGRPPGPLRLPAMAWLAVAFAPWKALWIGLALGHARAGTAIGAALAVALVAYRRRAGAATFFEAATAVALVAALPASLGAPAARVLAASFAALAVVWAAGAGLRPLGLSGEYARWKYVPALAGTALFRYPNVVISLAWAVCFLASTALALAPLPGGARAVLQATAVAACTALTAWQERGASARRIEDVDGRLVALRRIAAGVAAVAVAVLVGTMVA
jgi:putative sterol carrier protein